MRFTKRIKDDRISREEASKVFWLIAYQTFDECEAKECRRVRMLPPCPLWEDKALKKQVEEGKGLGFTRKEVEDILQDADLANKRLEAVGASFRF